MDPRRVLVVTDIDLSGWALRQALTSAGFVVLTAADAGAARAFVEASDPFDVLVVSQSLGPECVAGLLEDAARLWPGVPAIVLAVDPEPHPIETRADRVLLEKPYSVDNVVALASGLVVLRAKGEAYGQLPSRHGGVGKGGVPPASRRIAP
jgi:DNA-binding NtrC family response regulator